MIQTRIPGCETPPSVEHDRLFLRAVDNALNSVGLERFCEHAGADKADVSRGRNGKRKWQQEWTDRLLEMPGLERAYKVAIHDAIGARAGLMSVERPKRSVVDIAQAAIAELRTFGEKGAGPADALLSELVTAVSEARWK